MRFGFHYSLPSRGCQRSRTVSHTPYLFKIKTIWNETNKMNLSVHFRGLSVYVCAWLSPVSLTLAVCCIQFKLPGWLARCKWKASAGCEVVGAGGQSAGSVKTEKTFIQPPLPGHLQIVNAKRLKQHPSQTKLFESEQQTEVMGLLGLW